MWKLQFLFNYSGKRKRSQEKYNDTLRRHEESRSFLPPIYQANFPRIERERGNRRESFIFPANNAICNHVVEHVYAQHYPSTESFR